MAGRRGGLDGEGGRACGLLGLPELPGEEEELGAGADAKLAERLSQVIRRGLKGADKGVREGVHVREGSRALHAVLAHRLDLDLHALARRHAHAWQHLCKPH